MDGMYKVPVKLKQAIQEGRCIAFVGAGFAGAAQLPTWEKLLVTLAHRPEVDDALREHVVMRLQEGRADRNEEAAQMLHDALGTDKFIKGLQEDWGYSPVGDSTAERLLMGIRKENIRVPTLIFSIPQYADERKRIALGLGAQGYYFTNEGLVRAIERIFTLGAETG